MKDELQREVQPAQPTQPAYIALLQTELDIQVSYSLNEVTPVNAVSSLDLCTVQTALVTTCIINNFISMLYRDVESTISRNFIINEPAKSQWYNATVITQLPNEETIR